jgi:hypothetical protein
MPTSESTWARRWFPSRLFLPHAQRKTLAFTALEVPATLLGPVLPLVLLLARARLRRAPAPPPPAPAQRVPVWLAPVR